MEHAPEQDVVPLDPTKKISISHTELSRYHGLVSGIACAAPAANDLMNVNRAAQLPGMRLPSAGLGALLGHVRTVLEDASCAFKVQIPDDDTPLRSRVVALGEWSRSFLEGFALAVESADGAGLRPEVSELLGDLSRIAADLNNGEVADDEENERDFVDIGGYIEVAAMNLFLIANGGERATPRTG